jgi:hypothetical protein
VSAITATGYADSTVPDDAAAPPKPAGRRGLLQAALAAAAALLLVAGVGLVVLPSVLGRPAAGAGTPPAGEELRAWRVSDHDTAGQFDGLLQSGWRVERADTDNWGTTYVVRRPRPAVQHAAAP